MENRRDKIIEIAAKLRDLANEKAVLERDLDALITPGTSSQCATNTNRHEREPRQLVSKGEFLPGSVPHQIVEIMNARPDSVFSAEDLSDEEKGRPIASVRNAISRLVKNKHVVRKERGRFQIAKKG